MILELNRCLNFQLHLSQPIFETPFIRNSNLTINHSINTYPLSVEEQLISEIQYEHLDQFKKYLSTQDQQEQQVYQSTQCFQLPSNEKTNNSQRQSLNNNVPSLWQPSLREQIQEKIQSNKTKKAYMNEITNQTKITSKSPIDRRYTTQPQIFREIQNISHLHKTKYDNNIKQTKETTKQQSISPIRTNVANENQRNVLSQNNNNTVKLKLDIQKFMDQHRNTPKRLSQVSTQRKSLQCDVNSKSPQTDRNRPQYKAKNIQGTTHININLYKK